MGFAVVTCSRNWTPMCDTIQQRMDAMTPYLIVGGLMILLVGVGLAVIGELRRGRRPAEPRAAEELRNRLDD